MGFLTSIDKKLHKLNVGASILHAGIGVGMAAWYFTSKNRDPDKVKTSLYKLYTCGKPGEDAPCLKEVIQGNANGIMAMMLTFIFFTSMMHMVYACCRKWYSRMMGAENNYARWIEYSISATILLVAIMLSSDTKEFNVIFISIFAIIGVMLSGDVVEKVLANSQARGTLSHITATLVAWIVFAGVIGNYCLNFYTDTAKTIPGDAKKIVSSTSILTLVFYISFGFVQLFQVLGKFPTYEHVEGMYIILSFVSKATLGMLVTSGIIARTTI